MPENPLLPDAELRTLLALLKRCATLENPSERSGTGQSRPHPPQNASGREAVLAATVLQLKAGDLFLPEPADAVALSLVPQPEGAANDQPDAIPRKIAVSTSRFLLGASMAAALRLSGSEHLVLLLTSTNSKDPGWAAALAWAQERLLPLVVVCTDPRGPAAFTSKPVRSPGKFDWSEVSRSAARLKLPVLTVDGEDAVAIYRATQEAMLRARAGAGPAVLWAALPARAQLAERPRTRRPVARLAQYLRSRGIAPA